MRYTNGRVYFTFTNLTSSARHSANLASPSSQLWPETIFFHFLTAWFHNHFPSILKVSWRQPQPLPRYNKQTNEQTNKQTNKQINKQTNKANLSKFIHAYRNYSLPKSARFLGHSVDQISVQTCSLSSLLASSTCLHWSSISTLKSMLWYSLPCCFVGAATPYTDMSTSGAGSGDAGGTYASWSAGTARSAGTALMVINGPRCCSCCRDDADSNTDFSVFRVNHASCPFVKKYLS